jgi:3-phenylpropionate/trans-cinnamate dioxygenase ferredoxin reductase component
MNARVLIAGGGLAAQRCCETLRRSGHDGPITVVCGERQAPYDRPPLSKELLAGELDPDALGLRPAGWYAERRVELLLGRPAAAVHADRHELELGDGSLLAYDRLLLATGAEPRRLPLFGGAPNAHVLRTAADAMTLRAALTPGIRLVVIGAGFIGQEVAATARKLGVTVTLLEAMDAPLVGLLGPDLGTWFADLHRDHGVEVHCGVTAVDTCRDRDGRITAIVTGDGRTLPCDRVLVGVGVAPADGWLAGSGLGGGGVECDERGCTALPDVYAAGDVARPYDPFVGAHVRSEHWEAAARQGAAAARAMLDLEPLAAPLASFWSDQYGLRIQHLGYASLGDAVEVDGDPAARDFAAVWRCDGQPVAALLVGRPRELPRMRRVIQAALEHRAEEIAT